MKKLLLVSILALASGDVRPQTTVTTTQIAPIWYGPPQAPWVQIVATAQLMTGSTSAATPAQLTRVGTVVTLPSMVAGVMQPITTFDLAFPVISVTTATSITGIVLTVQQSGGGIIFYPATMIYPIVFTIPPGATTVVHYDASISAAVSATITSGASAGLVTVSVTTPVAPPPPPAPTFTADGTKMPPATLLVDANGSTWTLLPVVGADALPGQVGIARNGTRVANSVFLATIKSGSVYLSDTDGWWRWTGSTFVASPAPF